MGPQNSAFDHAYAVTDAVTTEGADWDAAYTLKELRSVLTELIEKIEDTDTQRQTALGLRVHALSALYLSKILFIVK